LCRQLMEASGGFLCGRRALLFPSDRVRPLELARIHLSLFRRRRYFSGGYCEGDVRSNAAGPTDTGGLLRVVAAPSSNVSRARRCKRAPQSPGRADARLCYWWLIWSGIAVSPRTCLRLAVDPLRPMVLHEFERRDIFS